MENKPTQEQDKLTIIDELEDKTTLEKKQGKNIIKKWNKWMLTWNRNKSRSKKLGTQNPNTKIMVAVYEGTY